MLSDQDATEAAAVAENHAAAKAEDHESEEWELTNIPNDWKPAPLFKVRHIFILAVFLDTQLTQCWHNPLVVNAGEKYPFS